MKINYSEAIKKIENINQYKEEINIMEVCGTHTNAIGKFGIRNLLNSNINLISGPGCPVCVTPDIYIDYIYDLALKANIIIATYGDMLRVPGSNPKKTLESAKALGAKVKLIYSSMDAVELARLNPTQKVVFLGIGFETTTPATAIAIFEAKEKNITNFYVLSLHKIVEPVMRVLLSDEELKIHGFIIPGHVAVIIGEEGFKFLEEYNCPGVIAGFALEEIVEGIWLLINSIEEDKGIVLNAYKKLVRAKGNEEAVVLINKVFDKRDDAWRGIGIVPNSGYKLKAEYMDFDIENIYKLDIIESKSSSNCKCGEVLKGKIKPNQCDLFGKACIPENPIGPCMVSEEGSCAAYFRYDEGDL
ncbi:MAG: hydrogenase formation protein HypD [Clostridiaceae bacterium]|nr:hydrogenase formation protein HypD [Clostridiaceae bacterium]